MIAMVVGTALALLALSYVLYPLLAEMSPRPAGSPGTPPIEHSAIDALREIEFDRETGKLSETDYVALKSRYTERAVSEMRGEDSRSAVCPNCGIRPELAARFCSSCGSPLVFP